MNSLERCGILSAGLLLAYLSKTYRICHMPVLPSKATQSSANKSSWWYLTAVKKSPIPWQGRDPFEEVSNTSPTGIGEGQSYPHAHSAPRDRSASGGYAALHSASPAESSRPRRPPASGPRHISGLDAALARNGPRATAQLGRVGPVPRPSAPPRRGAAVPPARTSRPSAPQPVAGPLASHVHSAAPPARTSRPAAAPRDAAPEPTGAPSARASRLAATPRAATALGAPEAATGPALAGVGAPVSRRLDVPASPRRLDSAPEGPSRPALGFGVAAAEGVALEDLPPLASALGMAGAPLPTALGSLVRASLLCPNRTGPLEGPSNLNSEVPQYQQCQSEY